MNRIAAVVAGLSLAFVGTSATIADTINVPADYPTIQGAVDAANPGDEIVVAPGTYTSTQDGHVVDMKGKAVTLRSSDGPKVTIIDGENARRGVACFNGETNATVIEGFTITNGNATWYDYNGDGDENWWYGYGGGILCWDNSSPTITGCTISSNTAGIGAGIYTTNANPEITDCEISYNTSTYLGAGLFCATNSIVTIENCVLSDNIAGPGKGGGAAISTVFTTLNITGSTISNNYGANPGGGIYCYGGSATINDCMITGNSSGHEFGGGLVIQLTSDVNITNSWICDNFPDQTYGTYYESDSCITDDCEYCNQDWDDDGVPNDEDQCPDYDDNVDTDDDGTADGCDNCPNISNADQSDDDEDSIGDACDNCPGEANNDQTDDDEDSVGDACDQCPGEDDTIDTDLDGTPNCIDNCPNDQLKTEPGECGCGIPDTDSDKDDTPDCHDNCPNDPFKTEPGNCGCGVAETNTFGDLDCDGDYDIDDIYAGMENFDITTGTPGDVNADGTIDTSDLDELRTSLGLCASDTDMDGDTDIEDLLIVIGGWGTTCTP